MGENYEKVSDSPEEPFGKRWDPLGADTDAASSDYDVEKEDFEDCSRIKNLEDEQEMLTSSLIALTSHFAQVQLRLRQIVEAPPQKRDDLLKSLEEFAFRGVPEIQKDVANVPGCLFSSIESQRQNQHELIEQLKSQLEDLEKYAYESGAPVLPQSIMVAKQKVIIDELKNKINFNFDDLDLPQLSSDDLRNQVDTALGEFVSPLKMKEQLVTQLKTQIQDLERFITFLQNGEKSEMKRKLQSKTAISTPREQVYNEKRTENLNQKAFGLMDRAGTLLQMFAASQFGCGSGRNRDIFHKNTLKRTCKGNHWGDIRARLEVDVQEVASLVIQINNIERIDHTDSSSDTDTDFFSSNSSYNKKNLEVTSVVRKNLSKTIQSLLQHGLRNSIEANTSLVPFISGCFSNSYHKKYDRTERRREHYDDGEIFPDDEDNMDHEMHAWELILEYYNLKNGDNYNATPARKLSESFNLDIADGSSMSNKQNLLRTIGKIIAVHSPYKRSYNSHFKAFICAGLNEQKLTQWLNLIMQCKELIFAYYTNWSYVANTGFRDGLKTLDRLSQYTFNLPEDLAIRHFQNIKDVFM